MGRGRGSLRKVDLRIVLASIAVVVGLVILGLYVVPVPHITDFSGTVSADVTNFYNLSGGENFTLMGLPIGAHVALNWEYRSSQGLGVTLVAYPGSPAPASDRPVCYDWLNRFGACAWVASESAYSIGISQALGCPNCLDMNASDYVASVSVTGWYEVSSPSF